MRLQGMLIRALCLCAGIIAWLPGASGNARAATGGEILPVQGNPTRLSSDPNRGQSSDQDFEAELEKGTALTRQGSFAEAIPHLLAARGHVANEYARSFNLALCYLGTGQSPLAIDVLLRLSDGGHDNADVENLLAQAYVGNGQPQLALSSLEKADSLSPQNERLYAFVSDACMEHQQYNLGLKIVDLGLQNMPQSVRLHYERALFLAQLDELDQAKQEFERAAKLSPASDIAILAATHEQLLQGEIGQAIQTARDGVRKGVDNHALLTLLGEALLRSGASPGQPDFLEAQAVLERAVREQPGDAVSQIDLGDVYLLAGHLPDAISHLEKARQLDPGNPSVYAHLAKAYREHGELQPAQDALAALQKLNQEQADRIHSAPGERKRAYGQGVAEEETGAHHP
jgi:tetratricopeptide (TPR) repeat protein